jgi:2-methylcitrate dehydratase PrpD
LNAKATANALGLAGTQASGLREVFGTLSKPFQVGKAAMSGILASMLARRGFTSSERMLEAPKGFLRLGSRKYDPAKLLRSLGEAYAITRVTFKRWPSCAATHASIDATLEILRKHSIGIDEIKSIIVEIHPSVLDIVGIIEPVNGLEAKFSIPYCVAISCICGKVGVDAFRDECVSQPSVTKLLRRVRIVTRLNTSDPYWYSAKVTLETSRGDFQSRVDHPKGYGENPLTKDELEAKFRELTASVAAMKRENIARLIMRLDRVKDVTKLSELLAFVP